MTEISKAEEQRLRETRNAFIARLERTPEKHRRAVVDVTAAKGIGFGPDQVDPLTAAIATQMSEAFRLQDRIEDAKARLVELEPKTKIIRTNDPDFRARAIARKVDLETAIETDLVRYVSLQEDTLDSAKAKAVEFHRQADAQRERLEQRQEAIARAEAAADQEELDRWARGIVSARRGNLERTAAEKP